MSAAASAIADRLDVSLHVARVNVGEGPSPENQARLVRYRALEAAARPSEWVLTAHTSDDQAETMLDHLMRASGIDGLRGIPRRRAPFARPLLGVARSTTRELATLAGLPWEDDPVNETLDPLRNRIRQQLIPHLESSYNRRLRDSLATTAALVAADVDYIDQSVDAPIRVGHTSVEVPAAVVVASHPSPAARIVRRFLAVAGLEAASTEAVAGVLAVARGEVARHQPGASLVVRRRGAMLVAGTLDAEPPRSVDLEVPGVTIFGEWAFDAAVFETPPPTMPLGAAWMVADADIVGRLRVGPGSDDHRVAGLLADAGVPAEDRPVHPVVMSDRGAVWLPMVRRLDVGWADSSTERYLVVRSRPSRKCHR